MTKILIVFFALSNAAECLTYSDCPDLTPCQNGLCVHKSIFPLSQSDCVSLLVVVLVSAIASAGGVGGSSITLSLMLLSRKFNTRTCVAFTQIFIFASSATKFFLKTRDRHLNRDRLAYNQVLLQMASPALLGVSIGVALNRSFPDWLILSLLSILVFVLGWSGLAGSLKLYKREKEASEARLDIKENENQPGDSNSNSNENENQDENRVKEPRSTDELVGGELIRRLERTQQAETQNLTGFVPGFCFVLLVTASILFYLIKEPARAEPYFKIEQCSRAYFTVIFIYFTFMSTISFFSSVYLVKKTVVFENTQPVLGTVNTCWTYSKCAFLSISSLLAGTTGGLLGIPGQNLVLPVFQAQGLETSMKISNFFILLSSGTASVLYLIDGLIDAQNSFLFFAASASGSLFGAQVLRKQALKLDKISVLLLSISAMLLVSSVIILTVAVIDALSQSEQGTLQTGFQPFCTT